VRPAHAAAPVNSCGAVQAMITGAATAYSSVFVMSNSLRLCRLSPSA
jgi:cation transport ATPase